jgi:hypothetical protein
MAPKTAKNPIHISIISLTSVKAIYTLNLDLVSLFISSVSQTLCSFTFLEASLTGCLL